MADFFTSIPSNFNPSNGKVLVYNGVGDFGTGTVSSVAWEIFNSFYTKKKATEKRKIARQKEILEAEKKQVLKERGINVQIDEAADQAMAKRDANIAELDRKNKQLAKEILIEDIARVGIIGVVGTVAIAAVWMITRKPKEEIRD